MTALLSAAKSGVGLAALPMTIGDNDPGLVRVLGPIPGPDNELLSTDAPGHENDAARARVVRFLR